MSPLHQVERLCACGLLVPLSLAAILVACGGDDGSGGAAAPIEYETISGRVIDGYVADALVCLDLSVNGSCDPQDIQVRSDATGSYALRVPKGLTGPLIAEVTAGRSRDLARGGAAFDTSFRLTSPSPAYSANITPYTTLVHLTGVADYRLAEDIVRDIVGLPSRFAINVDYIGTPDSLASKVASSVVQALKAVGMSLNLSSADALSSVVANLPPALTTLPTLRIVTKNGAPIVSKESYVDAIYTLTDPMTGGEPVVLNGKIRGRGNVTWGQPKNPYKVQFANDASYAKVTDVLGMKKNRNWALLADWFDKTLMRNKFAFALANSALFNDGLRWNPTGQHVEVFLNDDYVGVYLMMEDIRIDPARLNIKKMGKADVDGGYIVEADGLLDCYKDDVINLQHRTPYGGLLCIDTPDEESITPQQQAYIKSLIDGAEADLYGPRTMRGLNVKSFADWYLLSELLMSGDQRFFSLDLFYSSVRMWKDTDAAANPDDRLLNLGPIWDFDLSTHLPPGVCWISKAPWLARMLEQPEFLSMTLARWQQKRPGLQQFIDVSLDTYARRLDQAQQRNFVRWQILGVRLDWGNPYPMPTYEEQVAFLKTWLKSRIEFLDMAFASPENFHAICR
jgi:hypothetical protein